MQNKDGMWAKQFREFSIGLNKYILGQLSNASVEPDISADGVDFIVTKRDIPSERYGIMVRSRNIPQTENKSYTFEQADMDKLESGAKSLGVIPVLSLVLVDEMEGNKKIRVVVAKLDNVKRMSEDSEIGFLNKSPDGISLRYTEGDVVQWMQEIRKNSGKQLLYFELQFTQFKDFGLI